MTDTEPTFDTEPLGEACFTALEGLSNHLGPMVVTLELEAGGDRLIQSAAALSCLSRCVERGFAKHTKIAEATGLFEITSLGQFRYEMEASKRGSCA